jgi:hypothetical protein
MATKNKTDTIQKFGRNAENVFDSHNKTAFYFV